MTARHDDRRDVRFLDALLRTGAHPRDVALGVGAGAGVYLLTLFAIDLAGVRGAGVGVSDLASTLASGVTGVVSLVFTLAAPTAAGSAVSRDRASGAFDLAREAEPSAARRLAAYAFAPMWPSGLAVVAAFATAAPFVVGPRVPLAAWALGCAGVLAYQAASSLVAVTWALLLPRAVGPNAQGVGFAAPLALGLPWALFAAVVEGDARPAVPVALALGVVSLWPTARALVERPERPFHAPAAAVGTALTGLSLGGLGWAFARHHSGVAPWLAGWAVLTAAAVGIWVLPRAGRLALALREGRRGVASTAVGASVAVSALFALGAAVLPSRLAPAPETLLEGTLLVAAAGAVLTAVAAVVRAAPLARRGVYVGRAVLGAFVALLVEVALARSEAPLAARVNPLASLWTSAPVADGAQGRAVAFAVVVAVAALVARAAWARAERRVEAAIDRAS